MFLSSSASTGESTPKNPSTSSSFLHLTNSSDELGQSHHSSVSIRDYASNYRTENIQKSWPFSSTSFQLCLKHGLTDLLPPMQPLNSVVSHPPEASSSHIALVEAISCKRKFEKLGSNHALEATKQGLENGSLASGPKSKIQVANINKSPIRKCGSIVKPGACVDSESKEDQGCLFESTMALRTCPICKTFSSVSNTTLNAHIDKCVSVDSGQQPNSKPRRKVKRMVDIYATAKRCTLEDIDQRNGTKWAVVSSYSSNQVVSDNNKPQVCNKRKKRSVLHAKVDEDAATIGPVYIDAKGQKLRIISEFNEKASEEDVSEKESSKEGKGNHRGFRERLLGKKYHKHCKGHASEILECRRGYSEECRVMDSSGPTRRRNVWDQPSENGHSLSADPPVSRGPSHANFDLTKTVSSPLNSHNSWRSCGESQVSGKITKRERCSMPVDKVKLKKAQSENEEEGEDSGRWESEMTQERVLTDYSDSDDNKETDTSTSGGEDDDYESWEETGNNNKGDDNMLDKTNDADAEFESMIYERTGCGDTAEQGGSTFMEVDPIPIPGPPGSFLQSPWDMETDVSEHRGNFSVKSLSESTFGQAAPHMIQQDLGLLSKSFTAAPSSSTSVLRLMGKDLMVINQREDTSRGYSCPKLTSQFQDLAKTQHVPPPAHLLPRSYGGNGLYHNTSTNFYNIP
ncbi:hypothetical protein HID58_087969 [Brassica napus]|uniref:BnaCnng39160D protein n=3 Tax=Brassica TaxID=3705 RepID=A0A078JA71_BRANA|nr:PREDICTED: uncharacterized protein LOC106313565 [Brassica oleracea var. oleracea]XP_013606865.1 PREDICTED: uncharacterized protein LOC106313565 [Brassica oleracea var. oleracea]XP_013606866.1 PREDICTED: uncharacterized protein LOC106313565 [Brassica oleracea var. oleracea]XP_048624667.1 uncharacterized protein LOC106383387 [Brassica napus]XP_048624668.1 uncharacterized protein LOC106383387 [Brassica napus]KAH0859708.1 hypothetical protein HID58_087969 [Brassica napus]CAF1763672.1 unnamed p